MKTRGTIGLRKEGPVFPLESFYLWESPFYVWRGRLIPVTAPAGTEAKQAG